MTETRRWCLGIAIGLAVIGVAIVLAAPLLTIGWGLGWLSYHFLYGEEIEP